MNFEHFKSLVSKIAETSNGGTEAQFKLAPEIRKTVFNQKMNTKTVKKAAVLALFYPNNNQETQFLLTKRASYKGVHSAQISFPGGKFEENDVLLQNTALREANEEIGVHLKTISVIKEMTDVFIPPSNFLVTPFLGISNQPLTFTKNHEVEEIIQVSLTEFLNDTSISSTVLSTSYAKEINVPCFVLNNYIVWGATAMMLSEIRELLIKM